MRFIVPLAAHSVQLPIAWWLFRFSLAENVSWQPNVEGYFCLLLTYILIFDTTIVQLCFFFLCFLCFYFEVLQFFEAILVQNKYHGHSMYVCVYVCFYTNNGLKNKRWFIKYLIIHSSLTLTSCGRTNYCSTLFVLFQCLPNNCNCPTSLSECICA